MNRVLFLTHRYLGIGLGALMVVWCLSGIVMMYVPYPSLERDARLMGLMPLGGAPCCVLEGDTLPGDDETISSFDVEVTNGNIVLTARSDGGRTYMADLSTGAALVGVSAEEAEASARDYARVHGVTAEPALLGEIETDQWTTGNFRNDRPLYLFALNDDAGTELYVSSMSGKAVQVTNAHQRFWNWFGSVPHWLYFSQLREDGPLWSQIVIWTSLIGCVLTLIGIYIGIRQVKRRRSTGRLASPYRGLWYWHHVPGLIFGLFTLTWVFSGLLSMNPWGFLGNSDPSAAQARLYGGAPQWADIRASLPQMIANAPEGTVHLTAAPLDGGLYALAATAEGIETRIDANGNPAPLSEADIAASATRIGEGYGSVSWDMLAEEDAYYYGRANAPPPFPVVRVTTDGENAARFYLNPVSGRLVRFADADARWSRWLFNGLHSLDFTAAFRWRPFWDVLMIVLLLGATVVCGTGTWLGVKRLLGKSRGQGFLVEKK